MDTKFLSFIVVLLLSLNAVSQTKQLTNDDLVNVEELYQNNPAPVAKPLIDSQTESLSVEERAEIENLKKNEDYKRSQLKSLTDLTQLSPFSDISMIQRKFLPKTERFQIYTALGLSTNSPWFLNVGGKVNFSYNFTEKVGVEASGLFLTSSEKDSAKEIRSNNSLQPERFILTKSNINLDLIWSPIYGKITKLNQEIIPFDMYFSVGGGISNTNSVEKNVPTAHIATGQIFAISKAMAFRWDYSWYMYQATPEPDSLSSSPPVKNTYNDLVFTAGISFFFPGAKYR